MRKKLSESAGSIVGTVDANGYLTYGIRNVADGGNWFVVQLNSVTVTDKPVSSSGISSAVIPTDNAPANNSSATNLSCTITDVLITPLANASRIHKVYIYFVNRNIISFF